MELAAAINTRKPRDTAAVAWWLSLIAVTCGTIACWQGSIHYKKIFYDVIIANKPGTSAHVDLARITNVERRKTWRGYRSRRRYWYVHTLSYLQPDANGRARTAYYTTRTGWNSCPLNAFPVGHVVEVYQGERPQTVEIKECLDNAYRKFPYYLLCLMALPALAAATWRLWRMR